MRFDVTILGSSSATPIYNRNPTAQALNINERLYLVDCGEGTQQQMLRFDIKASKIDYIFISHLHGDHYLGLLGLLSSLHLNGRKKPVTLFGPPALKEIIDIQLLHSQTSLHFELIFRPTNTTAPEIILDNQDISVETIILDHRIPCTGFVFRQKRRLRKIVKENVEALNVPVSYYPLLKRGADFYAMDGSVYPNDSLTTTPEDPKAYAYCSDTLYNERYFKQIKGVDLLYHEATFAHDMLERANETHHTTALQAGQIAQLCEVKKLVIGHFSARYKTLNELLDETCSVFANTELAIEGRTFSV